VAPVITQQALNAISVVANLLRQVETDPHRLRLYDLIERVAGMYADGSAMTDREAFIAITREILAEAEQVEDPDQADRDLVEFFREALAAYDEANKEAVGVAVDW
jgi:hypothetical protein